MLLTFSRWKCFYFGEKKGAVFGAAAVAAAAGATVAAAAVDAAVAADAAPTVAAAAAAAAVAAAVFTFHAIKSRLESSFHKSASHNSSHRLHCGYYMHMEELVDTKK